MGQGACGSKLGGLQDAGSGQVGSAAGVGCATHDGLVLLPAPTLLPLLLLLQHDLDDNGCLDSNEFRQMLQALGCKVSPEEADAVMKVRGSCLSGLGCGGCLGGCALLRG